MGVLEARLHLRGGARLHEVRGIGPFVTDVGAAVDRDPLPRDALAGQLGAGLAGQRVQRLAENARTFGVEPDLDRAVAQRPHVRQPHPVRGQHSGEGMDHDPGDAQRIRHQAGVLAPRASEAAQDVAGHVVAAPHRDRLDGVRHVVDRDAQESVRYVHQRRPAAGALPDLVGEGGELLHDHGMIQRLVLVRAEHPREELGLQLAEEHVAVGHAQGTAAPVAGGSGIGPGGLRPHPVAGPVERADRAAARRHRMDHHHGSAHAHPRHHRFERALVGAVVVGDVGRGPAHVERDDASVARTGRGLHRPHDAARGAGEDGVLALEQPGVGEAAVRLHEHEPHAFAELLRHPVDVAAQQGGEVGVRHRGVAAADELHQRAGLEAGGHLREPDRAGQTAERQLVLRMPVAVHEHDGHRSDPVRVRFAQGRLGRRPVEGGQDLAVRRHPAVHLRHPLVEHLGEGDAEIEQMRPGLVADAKRVAKAPVDHQQGPVALALQQGVGGDRGAHPDGIDPTDRSAGGDAEQRADARDGRVAVMLRVVGEQLVGHEGAAGTAGDHVGKGPAAVDPELPAGGFSGHVILQGIGKHGVAAADCRPERRPPRGEGAIIACFVPACRIHELLHPWVVARMGYYTHGGRDIPELRAYHVHRPHDRHHRSHR